GQASLQMMLAAADLGIGSGHSAVGDQELARRLLGLPDGKLLRYVLDFGYPADRPLKPIKNPKRRPFDEVVHRGSW
ncbi:MAG: nitroreductase family protein, partial [Solirubrobacteraceae bacterium]